MPFNLNCASNTANHPLAEDSVNGGGLIVIELADLLSSKSVIVVVLAVVVVIVAVAVVYTQFTLG